MSEPNLDTILAALDTRRQYVEAGKQSSVVAYLTDRLIKDVPDLVAEVRRLRAALMQEDRAHDDTIVDRAQYHAMADQLAEAIAKLTGVDIGEHSSMNDPWQNALDAAERARTQETHQ